MRFVFVRLPNGLTAAQREDICKPTFSDVRYLDCRGADRIDVGSVPPKSEVSSILGLPLYPIVLLLENYQGDANYDVQFRTTGYNSPATFSSSQITVYCNLQYQPASSQANYRTQASKQYVTAAYEVEARNVNISILDTICYHLMLDFTVRQLYLDYLKQSINISGKSRYLTCMPDLHCTLDDTYLWQAYDCAKALPQLTAYYTEIMGQFCFEEYESLAVIVGAMIDAIGVVFDKREPFIGHDDEHIWKSSYVFGCEVLQTDFELPQIRGFECVPMSYLYEYSVFDMYDRTIYAKLKSPAARYYTQLAFDAYINFYSVLQVKAPYPPTESQNDPGRQTPRTVMLRRSAFAELIRMFMNDCGNEAMGLVNAESVIRKTILLHLRHISPDSFFVNLTDQIADFDTGSISVIKLGARKYAQRNILAVYAQLRLGELIPCVKQEHYDSIGNNVCFVQAPRIPPREARGVVVWREDEATVRAKQYIIESYAKIAAENSVHFAEKDLASCVPEFEEYIAALEEFCLLEQKQKEYDSKKKPEMIQAFSCGADCVTEALTEFLLTYLQGPSEKTKSGHAIYNSAVIPGFPYIQLYKSHVFLFVSVVCSQLYYKFYQRTQEQAVEQRCALFYEPTYAFACSSGNGLLDLLGSFYPNCYKKISECATDASPIVTTKQAVKGKPDQGQNVLYDDLCYLNPYVAIATFLAYFCGDEYAYSYLPVLAYNAELDIQPLYIANKGYNASYLRKTYAPAVAEGLQKLMYIIKVAGAQGLQLKSAGALLCAYPHRAYQSYSVMTADRSVFNAYPDKSKIELFRKWNSLQQYLHGYDALCSEFTDNFQFIGTEKKRYTLFAEGNVCFTGDMPIAAKLTGQLYDGALISCCGDELLMRKKDTSIHARFIGDVTFYRYFAGNVPLICRLLPGCAESVRCGITSSSLRIFSACGDVFSISDFGAGDLAACSCVCYICYNTDTTESSARHINLLRKVLYASEAQTSDKPNVIDTIDIPGLVSLTRVHIEANSLPDPFPREEQECTVIELPLFAYLVFAFKQSSALVIIADDGDAIFVYNDATCVLKQDGSFFAHFMIETQEDAVTFWPSPKPYTPQTNSYLAHDKKSVKSVETRYKVAETPQVAFSAPILLYGGQGFHFWHSILERRKRFMSNADLTSRLCFEKKPPVMKNRELLNEFQLLEPFELISGLVSQCKYEYRSLVSLPTASYEALDQAEISFPRIHHELFLPISDTYKSPFSGVYRFILGNASAAPYTPFYPSASTIDWNGNTVHLRLGAPHGNLYEIRPKTPTNTASSYKANGKYSAKPESPVSIRTKYYSQTSCEPVLPPLICETIHTDVVGEIEKLIKKREQHTMQLMIQEYTPKLSQEPYTGTPKSKKQSYKKKKDESEEIVLILKPDDGLRDIDTILNELEHIDVATVVESFKTYVYSVLGANKKALLGYRGNDIYYDGRLFDDFIKEAIPNTDYPSPIAPIMKQRYIIVPASPDYKYYKGDQSYDYSSHSFCTIENDVPWMVIENQEISPLLFFTQLLYFYNITNFYTFVHQYVTRISSRAPISQIPGYSYQPSIKQALLQVILAIKPLSYAPYFESFLYQFDSTFPYQEIYQHESYIYIFNFTSENDTQNWYQLELTKYQWREITRNREELIHNEKNKKSRQLAGQLVDQVKDIIRQEKLNLECQIEYERIRIQHYEIEKYRQQELLVEQAQAEKPKEYDHLIDKPLNNQKPHKLKEQKGKQISPFLSPRNDNEEIDDDDNIFYHKYTFGLSTLLQSQNDKHLRAAKYALGTMRTLPRIGAGPLAGALIGTLKVMPSVVCSRCDINYINVKNLSDSDLFVRIETDPDAIAVSTKEFKLIVNYSIVIELRHLAAKDSLVKFLTSGKNSQGTLVEDVQVVESKVRC